LSASIQTVIGAIAGKRSRRSWSDEEKQLLVAEALLPGASVADVARRHGVNANLLFNWRRMALVPAVRGSDQLEPAVKHAELHPAATSSSAATVADFIPIGVFARAPDGGPGLHAAAPTTQSTGSPPAPVARSSPRTVAQTRLEMDMRPGLIEIDLVCGTRLRVDAFVNEKALQRVLAVLTKVRA